MKDGTTTRVPTLVSVTSEPTSTNHELAAEDVTFTHAREVAVGEVQIGAAGGELDDDLGLARAMTWSVVLNEDSAAHVGRRRRINASRPPRQFRGFVSTVVATCEKADRG